jgi:hypothetical protein
MKIRTKIGTYCREHGVEQTEGPNLMHKQFVGIGIEYFKIKETPR